MKRLASAIAVILAMGGLVTLANPARGEVLKSVREEFWFIVPDLVNSEFVEVYGEAHILVKDTTLQDGAIRHDFRASAHGIGVGMESGQLYRFNHTYTFHTIDPAGVAITFDLRETMRLVSVGAAPNFIFGIHELFTMDETGDASLEVTLDYDVRGRDT